MASCPVPPGNSCSTMMRTSPTRGQTGCKSLMTHSLPAVLLLIATSHQLRSYSPAARCRPSAQHSRNIIIWHAPYCPKNTIISPMSIQHLGVPESSAAADIRITQISGLNLQLCTRVMQMSTHVWSLLLLGHASTMQWADLAFVWRRADSQWGPVLHR